MAIINSWEDYELPSIRVGKSRNQGSKYIETDVFDGPLVKEKITDDVVTSWDCSIICDARQSRAFKTFIYDVIGTTASPFYIKLKTERSSGQQLVRVISGIPQPKQVASNAWEYSFTLEALDFNFTESNDLLNTSLPDNFVRDAQEFTPMIRGLATGTPSSSFSVLTISRDRKTVLACTIASGISISRNMGGSWQSIALNIAFSNGTQNIVDASISDDGKNIFIVLTNGYTAYSKDNGITWAAYDRMSNTSSAVSLSSSGDGSKLFLVHNDGSASLSKNYGLSWVSLPYNLGNQDAINNGSFMSKIKVNQSGELVIATTNDGYVSLSINMGETFAVLPKNLGLPIAGNLINDIAISNSGAIIYLVGGNAAGTEQFFAKSTNFGSTFSAIPLVSIDNVTGNRALKSVACTPGGEVVYVGGIVDVNNNDSVIFEIKNFGDAIERRAIKSNLQPQYLSTIENNEVTISNVSAVSKISTDGQSYFATSREGYASRSVPGIGDLDYKPISDSYNRLPKISTEITSSINSFVGWGGPISSIATNEISDINTQSQLLYIGGQNGFIARRENSNWDDISEVDISEVKNINTNFDANITVFNTSLGVFISYDHNITRINLNSALELITEPGFSVSSIAMSNSGKYVFICLIGIDGLGIDCLSDDYGQTFNIANSTFSVFENTQKVVMSNSGQIMLLVSKGGRASLSFDYGKTFANAQRFQNSGASELNELVSACCSDDGKYMYVAYKDGYGAYSNSSGISWIPMVNGLGNEPGSSINGISCTGNGKYVAAIFSNGIMSYSANYGVSWDDPLGSNLTPGLPNENLTSISNNGKEWFVGTEFGRLFYCWAE